MKLQLLITTACVSLLLVGCGDSKASENKPTETHSKKVTAKKRIVTKAKPKQVIKGYSLDEFLNLSVMGLKPLMSREEVKNILTSKGFDIPASGGMLASAALGMDCKKRNCRAGVAQKYATILTREDLESDAKPEEILPFFFVDKAGIQRLSSLKYTRPFSTPIHAPNMLDSLKKKYGEPSRENIYAETSREPDKKTLSLTYNIHMSLPDEDRFSSAAKERKYSREGCFQKRLENITSKPSEWCDYLMNLDVYDANIFFAHKRDGGNLSVKVTADNMVVELNGWLLSRAVFNMGREEKLLKKIEEAETRSSQKTETLDDF